MVITHERDDKQWVLLLHRSKEPHIGKWNCVGGKIQPGETPRECAIREVREETGINLQDIHFVGIGTFWTDSGPAGFYVFRAPLPPDEDWRRLEGMQTSEGELRWFENRLGAIYKIQAVDNLPSILAEIRAGRERWELRFIYDERGEFLHAEYYDLDLEKIDLEGVKPDPG